MSFEQDYLSGCKKFEKSFHNFCEKIFPVLGKVTQCGIIEFDKNGYGSVVANRVDFAEAYLEKKTYKLNRAYTFSEQVDGQFITYCSRPLMRKIHSKTELFYEKEFDVGNGFYYIEKIDDGDAYRHYFFGSDDQEIYTHLVNNSARVKKFIKYIQDSDEDIFRYCKDSKFKFSGEFPDYFKESKKQIEDERRKKLIIFLKNTGKLDKYKNISKRELQCFELYNQGKSARETGEILGISNRTVETHFENLKNKLKAESKADLMEYLD